MKFKIGLLTASLFCAYSVHSENIDSKKPQSDSALHMDWLDTSTQPGNDFYAYANGSWKKNNPIPSDYSSWGTFNLVNEKVQQLIHQMLIKASENTKAKPGSIDQKVGDFYYSGMDETRINEQGITPLKPEFARIESINSLADLAREIPHLHLIGVDVLFGFGSMQDYKNSELMIGAASQGGLSLPDRDYYLKDEPKFKKIREAYVNHVAKMFELLGDSADTAAKDAQRVMDIETQMARASMTQVEQRDPHAVYHIMTIAQLDTLTPNFSWPSYLTALGQGSMKSMNMAMPDFFKFLNKQLLEISLADWKTYLRWHLLDAYAPYLSKPFVAENFKMVTVLSGTEKILPRWKRVVATENQALGFAIGKLYVDKYVSPQAKQAAIEMLKNIHAVLREDMKTLNWMSPETKKAAMKKLDAMGQRVGYPTKWWDYSSLKIDRSSYAMNVLRANEFLSKRDLNKIGKPIDRSEWGMTPQTINAYYDPSMNNINMPAGILQPPFFDPKAPMAVNYGSIGFIMGHEMTHGFDDQGSQFDDKGNLKNWWTPEDSAKFKAATQCIIDQFSGYTVAGGLHVQGKLVVGEATADLGGITLAYRAFHRSKEYKKAQVIDGMTPDQQFFLGTAHVWATNIRPQQIQNQVTVDPHPPAQFRVNGSLSNVPQFQTSFAIPENSPMVSKKRCAIW
ncbi:MAG: M13 family metallopeptidase [Legionellales bacterium]